MALTPGTRLGPYEITALLGVGGMGEVYRAIDTNLKRQVAIKVLPASVAGDSERLTRFQREAEVLAALNHPNIAHIHGVEHSSGVPALVMELVEGPTLAERIAQAPIPLDEALPMAIEVATALAAAHQIGVVHRDLKPANVKITPERVVKVLDFGLAKRIESDGVAPALSQSPTAMASGTRAGTLLGTAAYMSPEQARGRPTDQRADLWAFGAVLFEMLSGRQVFAGEDVAETIAHVLTQQPDWSLLPLNTPPSVRRVLRRCLEKEPQRRLDSAAAARLEIEDALAVRNDDVPMRRGYAPARVAVLVAGALMLGVVIAMSVASMLERRSRSTSMPVVRFSIVPSASEALNPLPERRNVTVAPNGRALVYRSASGLVVRAVERLDAQTIPATDGAFSPFFSPDGRWIGFFQNG